MSNHPKPRGCSAAAQHWHCTIAFSALLFAILSFGQDEAADFTVDVNSAFIWGKDTPGGAMSSTVEDPLTGRPLRKLSHGGVEVTSRMGFERVGDGRTGEFLEYATTVVNNTPSEVRVQYGGISVDGYSAAPPIADTRKKKNVSHADDPRKVVNFRSLSCFTSGFLTSETMFSGDNLSESLMVRPGTALTVSSLVRDPRNYSVRCSIEGCSPTGTIRYYLRIGGHDFVFIWPGSSVAYCGR